MSIFFVSDTHLGHANIIKYCNRPFSSIEEMDNGLIDRWNARVAPGDTVYHLGDFALVRKKRENIMGYLSRLNGNIHLIKGNHDPSVVHSDVGFKSISQHFYIEIDGWKIHMHHYPLEEWKGMHHGALQLHGHSHGKRIQRFWNQVDVGVDVWDYRPVTFDELLKHMLLVKNKPKH